MQDNSYEDIDARIQEKKRRIKRLEKEALERDLDARIEKLENGHIDAERIRTYKTGFLIRSFFN